MVPFLLVIELHRVTKQWTTKKRDARLATISCTQRAIVVSRFVPPPTKNLVKKKKEKKKNKSNCGERRYCESSRTACYRFYVRTLCSLLANLRTQNRKVSNSRRWRDRYPNTASLSYFPGLLDFNASNPIVYHFRFDTIKHYYRNREPNRKKENTLSVPVCTTRLGDSTTQRLELNVMWNWYQFLWNGPPVVSVH